MKIDLGTTERDGVPQYKLTREKISVETPDGNTNTIRTLEDYRTADVSAI